MIPKVPISVLRLHVLELGGEKKLHKVIKRESAGSGGGEHGLGRTQEQLFSLVHQVSVSHQITVKVVTNATAETCHSQVV